MQKAPLQKGTVKSISTKSLEKLQKTGNKIHV